MSIYENSIKCKYCSHFEPGANRCHLYYDYDQSLDKAGGGPYLKETSPDSRCSHFGLPAMDVMTKGLVDKRADGSYIVDLNDDPQLKQQLGGTDSDRFRTSGRSEKWVSVIKWLFAGLGIGFVVSFIWGAANNTSSFPVGIMIVFTIIFGCIGYFKD